MDSQLLETDQPATSPPAKWIPAVLDAATMAGTLVLLGSLFLRWYHFAYWPLVNCPEVPRHSPCGGSLQQVTKTGLQAHTFMYVLLGLCIAVLAVKAAQAWRAPRARSFPRRSQGVVALLTIANLGLVVAALVDHKWALSYSSDQVGDLVGGALLGGVAAVVAAASAVVRWRLAPCRDLDG